jgi:hypothetical protein
MSRMALNLFQNINLFTKTPYIEYLSDILTSLISSEVEFSTCVSQADFAMVHVEFVELYVKYCDF